MALSQSSKILVSDINTALSNKQDKLSYTPVKSVNGTTADSSGNVAISVSAPVTSVNGMTGTVTISSVSTATTATNTTATPNFVAGSGGTAKLPSGGTWRYVRWYTGSDDFNTGTASGGNTFASNWGTWYIAIRIA